MKKQKLCSRRNFGLIVYNLFTSHECVLRINFYKTWVQTPYIIDLKSEINSLIKDIASTISCITNIAVYFLSKEYAVLLTTFM